MAREYLILGLVIVMPEKQIMVPQSRARETPIRLDFPYRDGLDEESGCFNLYQVKTD